VQESDDHVGDLHAGVIDIVLHLHVVCGVAQRSRHGVAQYGVSHMADVRRFVWVDAGVFDEAEAWAAYLRVLVGCDAANSGCAVEADVEVAGACDLDAGDAVPARRTAGPGAYPGDRALLRHQERYPRPWPRGRGSTRGDAPCRRDPSRPLRAGPGPRTGREGPRPPAIRSAAGW